MLWRDRLIAGDRAGLRALASESPALTDAEALELVKEASWRGCIMAGAALAVSCKLAESAQEDIPAWLRAQSSTWAEEGARALDEGRLRDAAERICAHRLLNPDALSSVRAQRAFERAMRLGARAALVAGNHKEVIDLTDIALDTEVEFPELHATAARPTRWATSRPPCVIWNRRPPTSPRRSARSCISRGWRSTAAGSARPSTPTRWCWPMPAPTRAPATRPSASSAGWDRAIRGAREILSAGDPKAAWKLLDRVAQSWPQMTEVDHESGASWPCCTPRRVVWNRPAPPNAWRWANAFCNWCLMIPSACAWPLSAPCACTASNKRCPTGARSRNVPTIRLSTTTTSSAAGVDRKGQSKEGSMNPPLTTDRKHAESDLPEVQARLEEIVAASGRVQVAQDNLARARWRVITWPIQGPLPAAAAAGSRGLDEGLSEQWTTLLRECPDDLEIVRYCATRLVRNGMSRTRWPWSSAICPSPATIPPGCSPAPSC